MFRNIAAAESDFSFKTNTNTTRFDEPFYNQP